MSVIRNTLFFIVLLFAVGAHTDQTTTSEFFTVAATTNMWKSGERVVAIQVNLKAARISSLRDIPAGWEVTINNDPSWSTTLKATVLVGAAAIDDIAFFSDFLTIESMPVAGKGRNPEVEMILSVTRDFEIHREIKVTTLTLRKGVRAKNHPTENNGRKTE